VLWIGTNNCTKKLNFNLLCIMQVLVPTAVPAQMLGGAVAGAAQGRQQIILFQQPYSTASTRAGGSGTATTTSPATNAIPIQASGATLGGGQLLFLSAPPQTKGGGTGTGQQQQVNS
jgi:hypothetical protein